MYAFLILIAVILMVWTAVTKGGPKPDEPSRTLYIVIDVFVNVMLILEVLVRIIAFGAVS
jgi:hypothetical protein